MDGDGPHHPDFAPLLQFLARVPAVLTNETPWGGFGSGRGEAGWWVKLGLDLDHPLAWNVVQELGHVLNSLSVEEPLPTVFKPVSPPPYMNGGPRDFLSWVIESPTALSPATVAQWLEGRMPRPVDDPEQWDEED